MKEEKESQKARELRARIKALDDQEKGIKKKRRRLEQELALELTPYKIGDRIYYDGKPAVVTDIKWGYSKPTVCFRRVKNNGQLYAGAESEAWSYKDVEPRTELVENEETIELREARLKV